MWYEADAAQWDDVFATNVRGYFTGQTLLVDGGWMRG